MFRFGRYMSVVSVVIAVTMLTSPAALAALATSGTSGVAISDFTASPHTLAASGGEVTLKATVSHASSCRLASAPTVPGLPKTVACASGSMTEKVKVPANESGTNRPVAFILTAKGASGSISKTVSVLQYALPAVDSFTATPAKLGLNGGTVTLVAKVSRGHICRFSATPAVPGLPKDVVCKSGKATISVEVPGNSGFSDQSYSFEVTVTGGGGAVVSPLREVTVTASPALSARDRVFGVTSLTPTGCAAGCDLSINSISCAPGSSSCLAVGGGIAAGPGPTVGPGNSGFIYGRDPQGTWYSQQLPADSASLTGVSCGGGGGGCMAVGSRWSGSDTWTGVAFLSTGNPINPWISVNLPAGAGPAGIACPTSSVCHVVGSRLAARDEGIGMIYTTTDGGLKWTSAEAPSGTKSLQQISCPSTSDCYSVGANQKNGPLMFATTDGGKDWVKLHLPSGAYPESISCPRATTCYAAGGGLFLTRDGGATWTKIASASLDVSTVSCPTVSFCELGENLQRFAESTTDGGESWTRQFVLPPYHDVLAADCPAVAVCLFGGEINDGLNFDAAIFSNTQSSPIGGLLTLVEMLGGGFNPCTLCLLKTVANEGDPVNTETGDFWRSFGDLSRPGRGMPLSLTRTYNSEAAPTNEPFGYGWSFNYGVSLSGLGTNSVTLHEENGSEETFTLSGNHYTAPPRVQATLVNDGSGTYTLTRDATQFLTFDSTGQLISEGDLDGYVTTLSYGAGGHLTTVTDSSGRMLNFTWSGSNIVAVTDPMGRQWSYTYASGNLTKATSPAGDSTSFTYDGSHRMLTLTSPDGGVTTNVYDSDGRVTSQRDPMGRVTKFEYSGSPLADAGGSTTVTGPTGTVSAYFYQYGLMYAKAEGIGTPHLATWFYLYDPATLGQTAAADPAGNTSTTTFDANGNPLVATDAFGNQTVSTYNQYNEPLTVTDPKGVTTTNSYDSEGNILSKSVALPGSGSAVTRYGYANSDDPGDLTSMTDPELNTWSYSYDANGDRISPTDPLGNETTSTYDADGELTSATTPNGNVSGATAGSYTTIYAYNDAGQVTKTTDPLGNSTTDTYDRDGNLASVTDDDGHTTNYIYNLDDEQVEVTQADGDVLRTTYNADGEVSSDTDGNGHVTSYTYDPLGHEATGTNPDGRMTKYTYDGAGNLLSTTAPDGQVTKMTYDADYHLTGISYPKSTTSPVTMSYDSDGQEISMTNGTGLWSWTYNSLRELTAVTEGSSGTVEYGYDLDGHLTSIFYPDGTSVAIGYDAAGREVSVTDGLGNETTFDYNADSNLISESFLATTGDVDRFGYDADDQMVSVDDRLASTTLFSATYTRDAGGNIISDTSQPASTDSFGYTDSNQLCYAGSSAGDPCSSAPTGAASYEYDPAGNVTTLADLPTSAGGVVTETSQAFDPADQLCASLVGASAGTCSAPTSDATKYSYDTDGNLTKITPPASGTPTALTYNAVGELVSYQQGSTDETYAYSGNDLRMSQKIGGVTTNDAWDVSGSLPLLMTDGTSDYIYGPGGLPVEKITGDTVLYYHHDVLGSTRLLTDAAGAAVATYTYDAYGNLVSSTGSITNPLRYAGQYEDVTTGLYYMRARYYDPAIAQFLSVDPQVAQTKAPYAYASGNPVSITDPRGLGYCPDGVAIPFTSWCLDNPFTSLQQDEQNFEANSAALDNAPVAGWVIQQDPFYNDFRDTIDASIGIPVSPGAGAVDLLSTLSLGIPGPGEIMGWLGVEGAEETFSNFASSLAGDTVGKYVADHPFVEDTFDMYGGALAASAFQELFPDGSPNSELASLQQRCGF